MEKIKQENEKQKQMLK